uniref:NAC domain-containing protein n=1 Tax=Brassica campestris TaxID=3711 RepID=M4CF77_BRACM
MASAEYLRIRNELMGAGDELILSRYLKPMIDEGASWPQHFDEDSDVFNKNPSAISNTLFVIVKPRTETCGKTDGCEYGSWRTYRNQVVTVTQRSTSNSRTLLLLLERTQKLKALNTR